jgi:hypothetical protein
MTRPLSETRSVESRLADYYQAELQSAHAEGETVDWPRDWPRHRDPARRIGFIVVILAGVLVGAGLTQLKNLPSQISNTSRGEAPTTILGADGIPTSIDGVPVLRGPAINAAAEATDDEKFLIAGWLVFTYPDCFVPTASSDLYDPCRAGPFLVDHPPTETPSPTQLTVVISRLLTPPESQGPYVFQVHTRDPSATECPSQYRDECEHALVVDALIWPS